MPVIASNLIVVLSECITWQSRPRSAQCGARVVGGFFMREFISNEDGQGITEYGAILAFVAILVAVVFGITNGALTTSISNAFSAVVSQLNALSDAAAQGSS